MEQTTQTRQYGSKQSQTQIKKYNSKKNLYNRMNDIELNFMNMRGRVQKYFKEYPSKHGGDMRIIIDNSMQIDEPERNMNKTKNIMFKLNNGMPLGDDDKKHIKSIQSNKSKIISISNAYSISEQKAADAHKFFQHFQDIKEMQKEAMHQIIKTGVMYLTIGAVVGSFVLLTGYITLPSSAALLSSGTGATFFGQPIPLAIATFLKTNNVMISFKIMTVVKTMFTKDIKEVFKTIGSESISMGLIFVSSNFHILDFFFNKTGVNEYNINTPGILGQVLVNFQPNTFLSRYTAGVGKMLVGKISNYMIALKPDPKDLEEELLEQQMKFKNEMDRIDKLLDNGEIDLDKLTPEMIQEGWLSKTTKEMIYKNRKTIYFWTIASGISGAWISLALPALKKSYPFLGEYGESGTTIVGNYAVQYIMDTYASQVILGFLMGKLNVWVRNAVNYTLKTLRIDPNAPRFVTLDKYLQQKYGIEILHKVTALNVFSELLLVAGQMEVQSISYKIPTVMSETVMGAFKIREVLTWQNLTAKNMKMLFQISRDNALQITSQTSIGKLLSLIDEKFASFYPEPSSSSPQSQIASNLFPPSLYYQHGKPISLLGQEPFAPHTEENKTYRIQQAMLAGNTNAREQIDAIINIEKAITNLESEHSKLNSFISDNSSFLGANAQEYKDRLNMVNDYILNLRNLRQELVDLFSRPPRRVSSEFSHQIFIKSANKIGDKIAETNDFVKKTADALQIDAANINIINNLKKITNDFTSQHLSDIKQSVDGFNTFGPKLQNVQNINDQYIKIQELTNDIHKDINQLNDFVQQKKQKEFDETYKNIQTKLVALSNAVEKIKGDIDDATHWFNEQNKQYRAMYFEQQHNKDIKALNDADEILNANNHFNEANNYFNNNQLNLGSEYQFISTEKNNLVNEFNLMKQGVALFRSTIEDKSYVPDEKLRETFLDQLTEQSNDFKAKTDAFNEKVYKALDKYKLVREKQRQMSETIKDMESVNNLNKDYQDILNARKDFDDYVSRNAFLFGQDDMHVRDMSENIRDLANDFKQSVDNLRGVVADSTRFSNPQYRSSFDNALQHAKNMQESLKSFIGDSRNQVGNVVSETIKTNIKLGNEIIKDQYNKAETSVNKLNNEFSDLTGKGSDLDNYVKLNALKFGDKSEQISLHSVSLNELQSEISESMSILKGMIKSSEQFKAQTHKYVFDTLYKNVLNKVNQLKFGLNNLENEAKEAILKFRAKTNEYKNYYERDQLLNTLNTKYNDASKDFTNIIDKLSWNKLNFESSANQKILDQSENINDLLFTINDANNKMRKEMYTTQNFKFIDTLAKKTSQDLTQIQSLLKNLDEYVDKSVEKFIEKRKEYRLEFEVRETLNELNAINKLNDAFKSVNDDFSDLKKNINLFDNKLGEKRGEIYTDFKQIGRDNGLISEAITEMYGIISDKGRFSDPTYKSTLTNLFKNVDNLLSKHGEDISQTTKKIDSAVIEYDRQQEQYIQQQQTARDLDTLYKIDLQVNKITNSFEQMLTTINDKKMSMQDITSSSSYPDNNFLEKFSIESNQRVTKIQDDMHKINLNRQLLSEMLYDPYRFSDPLYSDKFKKLSETLNGEIHNIGDTISNTENYAKGKADEYESIISKYKQQELEAKENAQRIKDEGTFKLLDEKVDDMNDSFDYTLKNLNANKLYLGGKTNIFINDIYNMRMTLNEYKTKSDVLKGLDKSYLDAQYRAKFDDLVKGTTQALDDLKEKTDKISDEVDKNVQRVVENYEQINEMNKLDLRLSVVSKQIVATNSNYDKNKAFVSSTISADLDDIKQIFDSTIFKRNALKDSLLESLQSLQSLQSPQKPVILDNSEATKFDKKMDDISQDLSGVLNALEQTDKNIEDQVKKFFDIAKENERQQNVKESLTYIDDAFKTTEKSLTDVFVSERNYNQITSDNKDSSRLLKAEFDKFKSEYQKSINSYQQYDNKSIADLKKRYVEDLDKMKTV